MRHLFLAALAIWSGATVCAEPVRYISAGGGLYSYDENRNGAVLRVIDRQADAMLADTSVTPKLQIGDVFYLGRACDALSPDFGNGSWVATEGGFIVVFEGARVAFPGQTIPLRTYADCRGPVPE
ncbi:hypothetical protein [Yoonia litorea]|uniref:Uncharacterized protein n=1 Tax=Yoonia litorea TaxID=1123755 RepID=A0A1I6LA09_9RHOB|nr:hypothetical protein [Yoonia litorea]SFS00299.1 hypothetical protein SAMN05444714_0335 [Yoonia litorea]